MKINFQYVNNAPYFIKKSNNFNTFALLLLFLTVNLFSVGAQENKNLITLSLKNVSVKTFFKTIEQKSDYIFFYGDNVVGNNEMITVNAKNEPVLILLSRVLPAKNLTYKVNDRQITISRKKTETTSVSEAFKVIGVVKDATGFPLPGVNVSIKGQKVGTITDLDGNFSLNAPGNSAQIVASYVGFATQTVVASRGGKPLDIVIREDDNKLNEVVVIGYGTQKRLNMTGAVSTISNEILENRPISNIAQGLQGVLPNLNITFNSGQPNTKAAINIRGNMSLNDATALILVDGAEISDLSLINPDDIETISVLKDASSAAIYGPKAAFGVLLVTTKRG